MTSITADPGSLMSITTGMSAQRDHDYMLGLCNDGNELTCRL